MQPEPEQAASTASTNGSSSESNGVMTSRQRLESVLDGLARRAANRDPGRLQLLFGAVAVPTGLCMIALGWYGAANTFRVYQQVPYLISGALLGIGFVIAGAVSLVGFWAANLLTLLVELKAELTDLSGPMTSESAPGTEGQRPSEYVMTPSGTLYHRPTCSVVAGKSNLQTVVPTASMAQCRICEPDTNGARRPTTVQKSAVGSPEDRVS